MALDGYTREEIVKLQRTEKGLRFEKALEDFQALLTSGAKEDRDRITKSRKALWNGVREAREKGGIGVEDVYSHKTLQSLSVQYANDEYIGDRLMPIVNVGAEPVGNYFTYDKRSRLAYPDDLINERQVPNEIEDARSTASYSTKDYGYTNSISKKVVDAQDAPLDEMADLTVSLNEAMAFKREKRQAAILTTGANYSGNTAAIAAPLRWDSSTGGDPIKDIQTMLAATWIGRGMGKRVAFTSLDVWNVLSRHPRILDLFKFNGSSPGLATPDMLAKWFNLDSLLIGAAREDTANSGQSASYGRIWGNVFGVVRVAPMPSKRNAGWGATFRLNGIVKATQWYDARTGYDGRWWAKTAVSDDYKVVAPETGYLLTTVIG